MRRRDFCLAIAGASIVPVCSQAAPSFPTRPVRVISSFAAGGGPDVQLRQIGPGLDEALHQRVVIENKVGAAGLLAAQYVAQAAPDGYTLLLGSNTLLVQKMLQPALHIDPIKDFAPVCNIAVSPAVLVVRPDAPYRSADDLFGAARAAPGALNYGSGGVGTAAHLAAATMAGLAHVDVVHIPLKGSVEIAASLLRGETQFAFPIAGTALPLIKSRVLRPLAVTSAERLEDLPEVPTLRELMKSELAVQLSWFGIWAPAGTPAEVLLALNARVRSAVGTDAIRTAFEAAGTAAATSATPQAYADFVRDENRKWAEIIKLTRITFN
jgi:tripartite-type tricarboxylate transporter receptor subunit TctC